MGLEKCLSDPTAGTPYTSIKFEVEGAENSRPMYQHFVKSKVTDDFARNIFETEFKSQFLSKLKDIESFNKKMK